MADSEEDAPRPCDYCRQLCLALKYPSCYKSCLKHYSDVREISQLYAEVYAGDGSVTGMGAPEDAASLLQHRGDLHATSLQEPERKKDAFGKNQFRFNGR